MNYARAIQDALDEQSCKDSMHQLFWSVENSYRLSDWVLEKEYDIRPGDSHGAKGDQHFK